MLSKWGDMKANSTPNCVKLLVIFSLFIGVNEAENSDERAKRYNKCGWNVTTVGCPNDFESLQCLSEDYLSCPPGQQYHCTRLLEDPAFYRDGCAQSKFCLDGEAPYLVYKKDGRPTTDLHVVCDKCHSTDYFNSQKFRNSSSYFECERKVRCYNQHGIECPSDRYKENRKCRCNTSTDWVLKDMSGVDSNYCSSVADSNVVMCIYAPCEVGYKRSQNSSCVKKTLLIPTNSPTSFYDGKNNESSTNSSQTTTPFTPPVSSHSPQNKPNEEKTHKHTKSPSTTDVGTSNNTSMIVMGIIIIILILVMGLIILWLKKRRERKNRKSEASRMEDVEMEETACYKSLLPDKRDAEAQQPIIVNQTITVHNGNFIDGSGSKNLTVNENKNATAENLNGAVLAETGTESESTRSIQNNKPESSLMAEHKEIQITYDSLTHKQRDKLAEKVLAHEYRALKDYLSPNEVLTEFRERDFIQRGTIRDIEDQTEKSQKNEKIIEQVTNRLFEGYSTFKDILLTVNKSLLRRLLQEEKRILDNIRSNPDKYTSDKSSEEEQSKTSADFKSDADDNDDDDENNKQSTTISTGDSDQVESSLEGIVTMDLMSVPSHGQAMDKPGQHGEDIDISEVASGQSRDEEGAFKMLLEQVQELDALGKLRDLHTKMFIKFCQCAQNIKQQEQYRLLIDSIMHNRWNTQRALEDKVEQPCLYCPKGFKRLKSTGDGNCLFNSVSILLFGTEELSAFLRLCTAIYAAVNWTQYAKEFKALSERPSFKLSVVKALEMPTQEQNTEDCVQKSIMETARSGEYMSPLHVQFLSDAVSREIIMYFQNTRIANQVMETTGIDEDCIVPIISTNVAPDEPLHILWVNMSGNDTDGLRHIVPLIKDL